MPLVTNEQNVQIDKGGLFLKLGDKPNKVIMRSNVYQLNSHFIEADKKTVVCKGKGCFFCENGVKKQQGLYYYVTLGDQEGILKLPTSSFLTMLDWEEATGSDKRTVAWVILKKGSGLDTRYTTLPDNKPIDAIPADVLKENNKKLTEALDAYEKKITATYAEMTGGVGPRVISDDNTFPPADPSPVTEQDAREALM